MAGPSGGDRQWDALARRLDAQAAVVSPSLATSRAILGLTVYNGARFLPRTLEALLAQDWRDFSIVALDDGSDDQSQDILYEAARADPRISLFVRTRRLGLIRAWADVFAFARGLAPRAEYFAWCSDHDLVEPAWLSTLVGVLDQTPQAALAYPLTGSIDAEDQILAGVDQSERLDRFEVRDMPDPVQRVIEVSRRGKGFGSMVYGLIRADAIERAGVFRRVLAPDRLLIHELCLAGEIRQSPVLLRYQRNLGQAATAQRQRARLFEPGKAPLSSYLPWGLVHASALLLGGGSGKRPQLRPGDVAHLAVDVALAPSRKLMGDLRKFAVRSGRTAGQQLRRLEARLARLQGAEKLRAKQLARQERQLAAEPGEAPRLAEVYRKLGRSQDAIAQLEAHLREHPTDPKVRERLAGLHAEAGNAEAEAAVWRDLLAIQPMDRGAHERLFALSHRAGRPDQAEPHARFLVEASPQDAAAWSRLAKTYAEQGDVDSEIGVWREMIEAMPGEVRARQRLLRLLVRHGRLQEAISHARRLAQSSGALDAWIQLTDLCAKAEDAHGEIEGLEHQLKLGGDKAALQERIGRLLLRLGDVDGAAEYLLAAMGDSPRATLRNLAKDRAMTDQGWTALVRKAQAAKAEDLELSVLAQAVAAGSRDRKMIRRLCSLLAAQGRNRELAAHLWTLVEGDPSDLKSWRWLTRTLQQLGDAKGELAAWLAMPDETLQPEQRYRIARLLLDRGRDGAAEKQLVRAIDPNGLQAAAWRSLALGFADGGNDEDAAAAWRRVLAYDPGDHAAAGNLRGRSPDPARSKESRFDPKSFLLLHEGADVAAVRHEQERARDLLEGWSASGAAPEMAGAVLAALLERLGVLADSADIGAPMALKARRDAAQELARDRRFVELVALGRQAFASFLLSANRGGPDQNAILDPLWMEFPSEGAVPETASSAEMEVVGILSRGRKLASSPGPGPGVLICGFHHSGTRLLAQLLQSMGVFQYVNTPSYEWSYIQGLNTWLLPGWADADEIQAFDPAACASRLSDAELMRRLAIAGYDGAGVWGHKDPRNSVTAQAWLHAFPQLAIVNIVRDPLDVLGTLPAHYSHHTPGGRLPQEDLAFWGRLWTAYLERTRQAMAASPAACEIRFEDLCTDPLGVCERLGDVLKLQRRLTMSDLEPLAIDARRIGAWRGWVEQGRLTAEQADLARALSVAYERQG